MRAFLSLIVLTVAIQVFDATARGADPANAAPNELGFEDIAESLINPAVIQTEWVEEIPVDDSNIEVLESPDGADESLTCGEGVACGDAIFPALIPRRRWTVLTELTVLVPSYSDTTFQAKHRAFVGPRLTLGYESPTGFGVRGRGWGFDGATHAERDNLSASVTTHELLFSGSRLDLDFYKRIPHNTGDFTFGAGLTAAHLSLRERYTEVIQSYYYNYYYNYGNYYIIDDYDYYYPYHYLGSRASGLAQIESSVSNYNNGIQTTTYQGNGLIRNTGVGVGLMMEGTHRFYETPIHVWSLFGRGRVAYLVGRWEAPNVAGREEGDANMAIGEGIIGVEYRRRYRRADISLQCGFELQSWDVAIADRVNLVGTTGGLNVLW